MKPIIPSIKKIQVYFCGYGERFILGTLASDGKRTLFEYSSEALSKGIELSPRYLPLSSETYSNFPPHQFGLPGIFADSLPDGWGMLLMDRYFKKVRGLEPYQIHPLERLAFLGDNTTGAICYVPATEPTEPSTPLDLLDIAQAIEHIQKGEDTQVLAELALMGGSPQGARPKSLVYYDPISHHMSTHAFDQGEPWLVKFPAQSEHSEVCAIECAYLEIARLCGFDVPDFRYIEVTDKLSALVIKRFDRNGELRIPMHSLAGALHANFRIPDSSYGLFLRMTRFMTHSEAEVQKAFARCVFNVCMHNRDDHTKNFSYLMNERGEWLLSPAYDLTFNTGLNGHHQMDIEGESLSPNRENLLALAKNAGIPAKASIEIIDNIVTITGQASSIFGKYPIRDETIERIVEIVEADRNRLIHAVRITADVAQKIKATNPASTKETANKLKLFFEDLAQKQDPSDAMSEDETADFIKRP